MQNNLAHLAQVASSRLFMIYEESLFQAWLTLWLVLTSLLSSIDNIQNDVNFWSLKKI